MTQIERASLPLARAGLDELQVLAARVFERHDPASIEWRLARMPETSLFLARDGERLVGFKAGYAQTMTRYYSWLGGVDPDYRGQGVAGLLMQAQHDWLRSTPFEIVETHVNQSNDAMVALNMKHGLKVTGMFMKRGGANYIMQRDVS